MYAIRALMLGATHDIVAQTFFVTEQSLLNWIRRFNKMGIDGLIDSKRSGRPRKITPELSEKVKEVVEAPEKAGQLHWTGKKLHGYLTEELGKEVGYRTVIRWLHDEGYRLKVPQPWPDRQDETLRAHFVEKLQKWLADEHVDLWFSDEMGVEGDPRPRRRWAMKGSKPKITKNGDHMRMNVTGAINPRTGEFYAMEFTHSDADCFQVFLDQANHDIQFERKRNLLVMDNASWHKAKRLRWGKFEPVYLPPYSPDLNPIERLWLLIKATWFADFVAKDFDALLARLDQALLWAMGRKTCTIKEKL